ncbi:hypothetical protein LfeInf_088 [Lactobacillus phage LfeInf]|uniref:Uncharacterized protein n=1 Tax=Lactobacillus phage LfeInf TaxID=1567484 RepID=A0A0A7NP39_9CAUD|nr:anti-sigma factor [Lactobacillus phage LfeInf]AIZ94714.1 hypothetical protein LfeInf_088 [Lactobacillus phage LfeInf]
MGILTTTNSLRTRAIIDQGTVKLLVSCASKDRQDTVVLPISVGNYWYPLSPYLDFRYSNTYKHIILFLDAHTSQEFKGLFYLKDKGRYPFLEELYDYKNNVPGIYDSVLTLNLGLTTKFKSMGLATWDEYYNQKMVKDNFTLLSNTLNELENTIFERQDNLAPQTKNLLKFATKEEQRSLMDLGMAYRMNSYMQKIVKVRDRYE